MRRVSFYVCVWSFIELFFRVVLLIMLHKVIPVNFDVCE